MAKVLGVVGVFFKSPDPEKLYQWYDRGDIEENEYGKFGWFMDPDGNEVGLWEPPAGVE